MVGLVVPRTVAGASPGTRPVRVWVQNRSDHAEVVEAADLGDGVTSGLVRLQVTVEDGDGEGCLPALVQLDSARNARTFARRPKLLQPRRVLTVHYLVTYACVDPRPRSGADATPGDYRHVASVHHEVLDGGADGHPEDDACPTTPWPADGTRTRRRTASGTGDAGPASRTAPGAARF